MEPCGSGKSGKGGKLVSPAGEAQDRADQVQHTEHSTEDAVEDLKRIARRDQVVLGEDLEDSESSQDAVLA